MDNKDLVECSEHGKYLGDVIYHLSTVPCPACRQIKGKLFAEIREEIREEIIEKLDRTITINLSDYL